MPGSPDLMIFMLMRTDKTDFFTPYCACVHMPEDGNKIFNNIGLSIKYDKMQ